MDAIPAPGGLPAVAGYHKAAAAPAPEAVAAASVNADEAPKSATVEDVPDKDGPATGAAEPTVPVAPVDTNPAKDSVEQPATSATNAASSSEAVLDKPSAVNGDATAPSQGPEMAGALKDSNTDLAASSSAAAATSAPVAETADTGVSAGAGEREAAPQAVPEEDKAEGALDNKKRKAEDLEPAADGPTNGAAATTATAGSAEGDTAKEKRKPGRPPSTSNGEAKESLGDKVVKKAKKVLPVGKTERKTRSQGPA